MNKLLFKMARAMVDELARCMFYNNWNWSLYSHFGICRMFRCFEGIQWNAQAGFQYNVLSLDLLLLILKFLRCKYDHLY